MDFRDIYDDREDVLCAIARFEKIATNATRSLEDLRSLLIELDEEIRAIVHSP